MPWTRLGDWPYIVRQIIGKTADRDLAGRQDSLAEIAAHLITATISKAYLHCQSAFCICHTPFYSNSIRVNSVISRISAEISHTPITE
jgi:hypothetical protein